MAGGPVLVALIEILPEGSLAGSSHTTGSYHVTKNNLTLTLNSTSQVGFCKCFPYS
jgi:hypothetical protein